MHRAWRWVVGGLRESWNDRGQVAIKPWAARAAERMAARRETWAGCGSLTFQSRSHSNNVIRADFRGGEIDQHLVQARTGFPAISCTWCRSVLSVRACVSQSPSHIEVWAIGANFRGLADLPIEPPAI